MTHIHSLTKDFSTTWSSVLLSVRNRHLTCSCGTAFCLVFCVADKWLCLYLCFRKLLTCFWTMKIKFQWVFLYVSVANNAPQTKHALEERDYFVLWSGPRSRSCIWWWPFCWQSGKSVWGVAQQKTGWAMWEVRGVPWKKEDGCKVSGSDQALRSFMTILSHTN